LILKDIRKQVDKLPEGQKLVREKYVIPDTNIIKPPEKKIIAIGDSHAQWGFGRLEDYYIVVHLGPRTAYNIQNHDDQVRQELSKHPSDSPTIFCLGEVDCRGHISNHVSTERTIEHVVDEVTDRYTGYIKELAKTRTNNTYIMNVEPAGDIDDGKCGDLPLKWDYLNKIVLYFNKSLSESCARKEIRFLDIYDMMLEPNGTGRRRNEWKLGTRSGYDSLHLNNNVGMAVYGKYFRWTK